MFKDIGLILIIIALRIMMPDLFRAIDQAGVKFFNMLSHIADTVENLDFKFSTASVNYIPQPAPLTNSFR